MRGRERLGHAGRQPAPVRPGDGERRQITALSCEMLGVSGPPTGLVWRICVRRRRVPGCVSETADRHDGFVVESISAMPRSSCSAIRRRYEHDAEQAVRAGIELCAAVGTVRAGAGATLQCRVGITTGMAIIGDLSPGVRARIARSSATLRNLAVRLRLSAQPGIVAIEPATRRLIGGLFDCRDSGRSTPPATPSPYGSGRCWARCH